ncbi:MAG: asparaginase, partial [Planctomycetes bacterium]|nr:asparaginase [Planctomycetota bacterium]
EIAVATGSHAGEEYHHELVGRLLARGGLAPEHLLCGVHPPFSARERARRAAAGEEFSPLGNNCSGKHAGMLLLAQLLGAPLAGYLDAEHPVQRAIRRLLARFFDDELAASARAVDGCGVPTYSLPIEKIARGFARLHDDEFLRAAGLAEAAARLHGALEACTRAFSGEGRLPARFRAVLPARCHCKEGAEGSLAIWGPRGSLVVKCIDGNERGVRYLVPELLARRGWIDAAELARWRAADPPVVRNVAGREVGEIRVLLDGDRGGE